MRESRLELFRGRHFRDEVIVLCVPVSPLPAQLSVPIENPELNENLEFAHPPSSLRPGVQRASLVDYRDR